MDSNAYKDLGRCKLDAFKAKRAAAKAAGNSMNEMHSGSDQSSPVIGHDEGAQVSELKKSNELLQVALSSAQDKITELHAKCAASETGRSDADDRATRSARDAREAAEQLRLVESRVGSLQVEIDQVRLTGQASGDQIRSEVSKWKEQALRLEVDLQEKDRLLIDLATESKALEERYQRLHDRHKAAHNEFNRLKKVSEERKVRISELVNLQEASVKKSSEQEAAISGLQQEAMETKVHLEVACNKLSSITEQRDALKDAVGDLQVETQSYASQVSSLQSLIDELQRSTAADRDRSMEAERIKSQLVDSEQKVSDLQGKLVRAKAQFDKVKSSCAEYKEQLTKLKEEADALTVQKSHYEHQLADVSARSSGSLLELSHLQALFEQASSEKQLYQSQLIESQAHISSLEDKLSAAKSQAIDTEARLDGALADCARGWEEKLERTRTLMDDEFGSRIQALLHEAEISWSNRLSVAVADKEALDQRLREAEARAEDADAKHKLAREKLAIGKSKFGKLQSSLQERTEELALLQGHLMDVKASADAKVSSLEAVISNLEFAKDKLSNPMLDSYTDPLPFLSSDAATDPCIPSQADSATDAITPPTVVSVSSLTVESMIPQFVLDEAEERHSMEISSLAHKSEIRLDALLKELAELREAYSSVHSCLTEFQSQARGLMEQDLTRANLLDEARADQEKAQIQSEDLARQLEDLEEARAAAASTAIIGAKKAEDLHEELQARASNINELQRLLQESEAAKSVSQMKLDELQGLLHESEAAKSVSLMKLDELQRSLHESEAVKMDSLMKLEELQGLLLESEAAKSVSLMKLDELQRSLHESEAVKMDSLMKLEELQGLLLESEAAKSDSLIKLDNLQILLQGNNDALALVESRCQELSLSLVESEARVEDLQEKLGECLASLYSFERAND